MTVPSNRPGMGFTLGNHEERLRALEFSPGGSGVACSDWYTVGTPGVDGVDVLIALNPAPYNAPPYIPFTTPWTQSLGSNAPVQFMTDGCLVYLRGSPGGGSANTEIFVFPVGFRPSYQQPLLAMKGDGTIGGEADCIVYTTGSLWFFQAED